MAKAEKPLTALDRLILHAAGDRVQLGNNSDPGRQAYPNVWEWLSRTEADSEHLKDPARMSLALVPGGVQVSLTDASFGVTVDAVSESLAGVFEALERNLASQTPTIRTWRRGEVVLKKKPKKKEDRD